MFVLTVPGLGPLVAARLRSLDGVDVQHVGFDGRADVVVFEADRKGRDAAMRLATVEDVFVEVGRTLRAEGDNARWIARRVWKPARVERALSLFADEVRPLRASMTYRVVARVLQERAFVRTELRNQLARVIAQDKVRWRIGDPAQIEIWIIEYRPGAFVAGLRLSDATMRQHDGREVERQGALRPAVAAAMVEIAGAPSGALLDPCCGSGTILREAIIAGWCPVAGSDIDAGAVEVARANAPKADMTVRDARRLDLPNDSIGACVSNLPFGRQFDVEGGMKTWLSQVLAEMQRVTVSGGRVVVLTPKIPASVVPSGLRLIDQHSIRLLGTRTTLWCYEKHR